MTLLYLQFILILVKKKKNNLDSTKLEKYKKKAKIKYDKNKLIAKKSKKKVEK